MCPQKQAFQYWKPERGSKMKVFWKGSPAQTGIVTRVYVTDSGQKRMTVAFPYSTIDAEVLNFDLA